jgi:predicted RNA-binding Zn-ribbon protein involved in translation (DUF1610 family)
MTFSRFDATIYFFSGRVNIFLKLFFHAIFCQSEPRVIVAVKCRHCGHEFDSEAESSSAICPNCGKENIFRAPRVAVPPPAIKKPASETVSNLVYCPSCLEKISRATVFCPHCGAFFNVPFRLVWQVLCWFMVATVLIGIILALLDGFIKAIFNF